jgi:hypothetical protein
MFQLYHFSWFEKTYRDLLHLTLAIYIYKNKIMREITSVLKEKLKT